LGKRQHVAAERQLTGNQPATEGAAHRVAQRSANALPMRARMRKDVER
jgi:hypothetical protein